MKNYFYLLLLAVGLIACNKENVTNLNLTKDGNTFVGITLTFPESPTSRALPEDYNSNGEWEGRDKIESVTVFLVNETSKTINYSSFDKSSFSALAKDATSGLMTLKPNLAVKATAGESVKAYVVINDENQKIINDLKGATYAQFADKFNTAVDAIASEVSKVDTDNKEVILMTNNVVPTAATVNPGITREQAIEGSDNNMTVQVSRVVSRGIVTMQNGLLKTPIDVKDANNKIASKVTVKEIKYSIGASNKKLFPIAQTDWKTPEPVYTFAPTDAATWKAGLVNLDFSEVATRSDLQEIADIKTVTVQGVLDTEKASKFVLPLTHADANYRKGNTTYFEIRCTFVPDKIDDVVYSDAPVTVFLGANDGKFYSTREKAEKNGQGATQYKNGVMKYVLWLNPDKPYNGTEKITKSPVVRNQIYHAHISSFNSIGVPSNPLNPGPNPDPNNPKDPDDPNDPGNPKNPIDPNDPLQVNDTYISATIQVLQWGIHSYTVGLGSDIY